VLETLVKMMRNAKLPGVVRIKAAEAVLNRGIGLPAVAVDVTVQRVLAKKLCGCTIEELRAIEQHLADQAIDVRPAADIPST
jgi:endonuclease III